MSDQHEDQITREEAVTALAKGMFPADVRLTRPNVPQGTPLAAGPVVNGPLMHPTPSLNPEIIKALPGYDENAGYVQAAVDCFDVCYKNVQAVIDARIKVNRDMSETADSRVLKLAEFATAKQTQATLALDSAMKRLNQGIQHIEDALTRPLEQKAGLGTVNEEIRRHSKSLNDEQRNKFIGEALERNDLTTITAVAGAPYYLSGLSPQRHAMLVRQYREATSPAEVNRLTVMKAALDKLGTNGGLVLSQMIDAIGAGRDVWQRAARIRELRSSARDALKLA